jgi:hypothetical protein
LRSTKWQLVPAVPEYSDLRLTRELFERGDVPVGDRPAAPVIPFGRNVRDKAFFEATILGEWKKSVGAIVQVGRLLNQAYEELEPHEYDTLKLPFEERTRQKLRRIAAHPVISDPASHGTLPGSWRTLEELISVATPKLIREAIADGRIHPDLQRKDVRRALGLPPKPAGSKRKTNDQNNQEDEAPSDAVAVWVGFPTKDKRAILDSEGRAGLAKLLSPKLMGDLVDHLIGQQAIGATTESKRANALTALLRAALTAGNGGEVLEGMRTKLQNFKLTAADISVALHQKRRGRC